MQGKKMAVKQTPAVLCSGPGEPTACHLASIQQRTCSRRIGLASSCCSRSGINALMSSLAMGKASTRTRPLRILAAFWLRCFLLSFLPAGLPLLLLPPPAAAAAAAAGVAEGAITSPGVLPGAAPPPPSALTRAAAAANGSA
jgi:hypothetical protein